MGKRLYLKILIGSLVALTGLLTIAASIAISSITQLHKFLIHSVSGLAAIGGILILAGMLKSARERRQQAAEAQQQAQHPGHPHSHGHGEHDHADIADPLGFFRRLQFWGSVLLIASLPTFFLCRGMMRPKAPVVAARPKPPAPPKPAPAPEVVFPTLKVQGVVCSGAKSTAVLNGHTVQLGEWIEGVRVVAIEPTGVTVELNDQTRKFELN